MLIDDLRSTIADLDGQSPNSKCPRSKRIASAVARRLGLWTIGCSAFVPHRNRQSSIVNRRSGYTLIELLIVIAVLGISASLLVPNMVNRDWMNAQAAVRMVIGDLSFAQTDALAHQELRRVHFYEDGRGYCIVRITQADLATPFDEAATNHDYIIDPLGRPGAGAGYYIVDFVVDDRFSGVTIGAVNIDGNDRDLQYDSLGGTIKAGGSSGIPGTGGTIIVQSGTEQYQITIAPFTGKLTVVKL